MINAGLDYHLNELWVIWKIIISLILSQNEDSFCEIPESMMRMTDEFPGFWQNSIYIFQEYYERICYLNIRSCDRIINQFDFLKSHWLIFLYHSLIIYIFDDMNRLFSSLDTYYDSYWNIEENHLDINWISYHVHLSELLIQVWGFAWLIVFLPRSMYTHLNISIFFISNDI